MSKSLGVAQNVMLAVKYCPYCVLVDTARGEDTGNPFPSETTPVGEIRTGYLVT